MKKIILLLFSVAFLLTACKKNNVKDEMQVDKKVSSTETSNEANSQLKKYHKEGFLDKSTFVVIIIRPSDSKVSTVKMKEQGKDRAIVSLRRYIKSKGKTVDSMTNTSIMRLVTSNGELIQIDDKSNSRIVYIYEIKKSNLYKEVSKLGK